VSAVVLHVWHHFNIIIACLGYLSTVHKLDSTVHIIVVAPSNNKSASVVVW